MNIIISKQIIRQPEKKIKSTDEVTVHENDKWGLKVLTNFHG